MVSWQIEADFIAGFSLLGFILCYIPLLWHFQAWNVGCILYIFWAGTQCLNQFINIMVWRDNAVNFAPVWCDISTRFMWMARTGGLAAGLIIARRLCMITTGITVRGTRRDKMRSVAIDLTIGLGIPIAQLIIYWFLQGHRFDLYEDFGCYVTAPQTWLYIVLYSIWPIIIGLISAYYSIRTLIAFSRRRKEFSELLVSNNNLTFNRYARLMIMACLEVVCTVPLGIWVLVETPVTYKYIGLADLHSGFSRVRQYPLGEWLNIPGVRKGLSTVSWLYIAEALLFFALFGFAEEARRHYYSAYVSVAKTLGISTVSTSSTGFTATGSKMASSGFGRVTIPTFLQRSKRDSMGSFSDRLSTAISVGDFGAYDEKAPYSPSDSTAGSSTYLGSPIDEKKKEGASIDIPEIARPEPALDVESIHRLSGTISPVLSHHSELDVEAQREAPSVELPSSVRNSFDMV
ncbi:hypothetical protein EUX98_g5709 [Antrodiella citrinella]|uniref:G-protein coupled receptors family 1 profile domain-containing protein n=1 Tax=Antrodiella citrinella TaxID=2447956 RepID=A0A4S4MRS0_9APHY|nr:hypothetical protein EUX98_g5709 [Antrodiella citrinella]